MTLQIFLIQFLQHYFILKMKKKYNNPLEFNILHNSQMKLFKMINFYSNFNFLKKIKTSEFKNDTGSTQKIRLPLILMRLNHIPNIFSSN